MLKIHVETSEHFKNRKINYNLYCWPGIEKLKLSRHCTQGCRSKGCREMVQGQQFFSLSPLFPLCHFQTPLAPLCHNFPDSTFQGSKCSQNVYLCLVTGRIFFHLSPPTSNLNNILIFIFTFKNSTEVGQSLLINR